MEGLAHQIALSLGEPVKGNEYEIKVIDGRFWIEHKQVGSGEPLEQWIESEIQKFNQKKEEKHGFKN